MLTKRQKAFLDRNIASLGLSGQGETDVLRWLNGHPNACYCGGVEHECRLRGKERREAAARHTVGELLDAFKKQAEARLVPPRLSRSERALLRRFEAVGLDCLDFRWLSEKSLTLSRQKRLSAEEWRHQSLMLLGTLSSEALFLIENMEDDWKDRVKLTVQDLLEAHDVHRMHRAWKECRVSMEKTQTLLYALGFRYEDGAIMRYGTVRERAERYERRYRIGKRLAMRMARIDHR